VLEGMEGAASGATAPSPEWFARFARTMRGAYSERLSGLGDAEPRAAESCTTHLTACDRDGMMVAVTTTLLSSMGSRVVLPRSGVLLNNGVMWFDPTPGTPNAMAPGKRPLTNMCPVIATGADGRRPEIAAGASGGRRIMAAVAQMLFFVGEFGMDPDDAAHHPRVDISGPDGVTADDRLPSAVLDRLRADGPVELVELVEHSVMPLNFACPNLIQRAPDGTVTGISDTMSPWSAAVAQS
jgi:gamma-glutamyltranspeptidase / glutathione hydrolase